MTMEFLEYLKTGDREGVLGLGVTHEEYGVDSRTPEQKGRMEGEMEKAMKFWEVHVAPPEEGIQDEKK